MPGSEADDGFDPVLWERTKRLAPRVPADEGLEQLYLKLVACSQFYRGDDHMGHRVAVTEALGAVSTFLQEQGFQPLLLDPIERPVRALIELDDNRSDPMFERDKKQFRKGGRPARSFAQDYRTAILATLSSLWLAEHEHDGRKFDEILREAARKMKGAWFGEVTLAQLKSARAMVSQAEKEDRVALMAREYYGWLIENLGNYSAKSAFARAIAHQNALPHFDSAWGTKVKTPHVSSSEDD